MSTRLQRALDDLKAVEKDKKKFSVNMGLWAQQGEQNDDGDVVKPEVCAVCHAGSVLAKSINGPLFKELMKKDGEYDPGNGQLDNLGEDPFIVEKFERFLLGVNNLRTCGLYWASKDFELDTNFFDGFKHRDKHVDYEDDKTKYKKWFQLVVNYVKRNGY